MTDGVDGISTQSDEMPAVLLGNLPHFTDYAIGYLAQYIREDGIISELCFNKFFETLSEYYDAAAGAGGQVSYNQALLAVKKGAYENALNLFVSSKYNTFNFALAKLLNYSVTKNADAFDAALGIISKAENQEAANVYYLKAILAARKQDSEMLFNNLRTAIEKDGKYKAYAQNDIEFAQYAADATFKGIVE